MTYVFSKEVFETVYGKPKGIGVWTFGDRNKTVVVTVGSDDKPLSYAHAKVEATRVLSQMRYPVYKTVYLHTDGIESKSDTGYGRIITFAVRRSRGLYNQICSWMRNAYHKALSIKAD